MALTLINSGPSPYGRKVAVALLEKGLEFEVQMDTPWAPDTVTPKHSPMQQLPILLAGDETVYDSSYIVEWIEIKYPHPPLLPTEPDARLDAKKRQMLGERLMEVMSTLAMELARPVPGQDWLTRQTRKIEGVLAELDSLYAARGPASDQIDLGDIAVATTLLIFEHGVRAGYIPEVPALRWRGRHARLTDFVESVEERPSFVATRPQAMELNLEQTVG